MVWLESVKLAATSHSDHLICEKWLPLTMTSFTARGDHFQVRVCEIKIKRLLTHCFYRSLTAEIVCEISGSMA